MELELSAEREAAARAGLHFTSLPIADRGVPERALPFIEAVGAAAAALRSCSSVVVHCRMGVGRSSMFAAACLIALGVEPQQAWADIAAVRGRPVPDVPEQRAWVDKRAPLLVKHA